MSGPRFGLVLLDLDGTLLDTRRDLVAGTNHVRESFGLRALAAREIERLVGHGAPALVERALGAERRELHDEGLRRLLEHYGSHCLDHTRAYAGMVEALDALAALGVRFAVLTNKPQALSRRILDGLGLSRRMIAIVGGDTFAERKPHPRGVEYLREVGGAERAASLMVGDSRVDVETARAAGIAVCGVRWGLDPEGLEAAGPDFLASDAADLERVVRGVEPAARTLNGSGPPRP
ncbi:MAG: HAD hydrolase-like protein [Deltaproteobacteria bacterium]|nr:HAD hydrolase-like protein [Deltaproteobacteria bacterium]